MSEEELNLDIMKECNTCLVLLTKNYVKNESIWYQAIEAHRTKKHLVAFIQEGIILPERLEKLNWSKKYYWKTTKDFAKITRQFIKDLKKEFGIDKF